jgi:hypothetical protein
MAQRAASEATKRESVRVKQLTVLSMGLVFAGCVVSLVGCSVENDPSAETETVGTTEQAISPPPPVYTEWPCSSTEITPARKAAQATATKALAYLMGNSFDPMTTATPISAGSCNGWKLGSKTVREDMATMTNVSITKVPGVTSRCGLPATVYRYSESGFTLLHGGLIATAFTRADTDACLGKDVGDFFAVGTRKYTNSYGQTVTEIDFDPEPATLTANLGSSTGATAAAYLTNTPDVLATALKWGTSYTSCGTSASRAGWPCSPVVLSAGAQVNSMLIQTGTLCSCQ